MAVKIITGAAGSGKTAYCINEIRKTHEAEPNRRCTLLVPSHYTHETEKRLIDEFGGTGLNNIEVTSFEKLAREMLGGSEKRLAAPGKQALICRAVELCRAELERRRGEFDAKLIAAVGKQGFLDVAASLISELRRYSVTADALSDRAEKLQEGSLKQKLEITALIVNSYDELLADTDYVDSDEDLHRLSEVIGTRFGADSSVWMDMFDELLPQQREALRAVIDSGAKLTAAFVTCGADTYYGTRSAIEALVEYAGAEVIELRGGMAHIRNAPDLKALFSGWFDRTIYRGAVPNAEIFEARDAYTEIEHIAGRILDFVREDGYRYRDISVICGRPDAYSHIIEAVFDEYEIPYYSDERLSIAEHPIAMQILALFDIIENDWSYQSMFEYFRAGFIYTETEGENGQKTYRRVPSDSIDALENYVLKYGIRGKSMWCRSWETRRRSALDEAFGSERKDGENAELDALRARLVEAPAKYCEEIKTAKTVDDHCRALFRFIENINLYAGLKAELLGMALNRATADAQRFGQIWNLTLDILDQVSAALGVREATHTEFCGYIRAAMTKCAIRTVPSGIDRVFIGSVEKNQSVNPKILFMAGAVSGTFPAESAVEGFFSNADRECLESENIQIAPTTVKRNAKLHNSVYRTLSAVTDKLCVSYPVQTSEGKGCRAARIVSEIRGRLPGIRVYNDIVVTPEDERRLFVSSPKATLHKLLIHPKEHPLWSHVAAWYDERGEWRSRMFTVSRVRDARGKRRIELDPKLAGKLYGGRARYSATRLNSYAECPFRYFAQYGLRLREREEWELSAADTGSCAHELIKRLCERVDADPELNWRTLSDSDCERLVSEEADAAARRLLESELNGRERAAHIFSRIGRTVAQAAKTAKRSIAAGDFELAAYEKTVDAPLTDKVSVTGVIDRLDVCRRDGVNEYRIIDYKTGSRGFSPAEIYNRYNMQPVIYALVERMSDPNAVISGLYYERVKNDFARARSNARDATVRSELKKNTELSGVTFVDTDAEGNILPESVERVESEQSRAEEGVFFAKEPEIGAKLRPREDGERLMERVRDSVIGMDREIRGGNIEISPLVFDSRRSACSYCAFGAACRFDEEQKRERRITEKDADVWELLKGED